MVNGAFIDLPEEPPHSRAAKGWCSAAQAMAALADRAYNSERREVMDRFCEQDLGSCWCVDRV